MSVRLWIFDADGTLRRTTVSGQVCPRAPCEWELLPNVREKLHAMAADPTMLFGVASNQDQVGYGHLTEAMAQRLLSDALATATGRSPVIGSIVLCPHRLEVECDCRKPAPGMLLQLLRRFVVPAIAATYVGDQECDAEAARRAGIPFRWAADVFEWSTFQP